MSKGKRVLPETNIAILAYGSLLTDPGEKIKGHILGSIPQETSFPVEYARASRSRGGAPTLVRYPNGKIVQGRLLILDLEEDRIEEARRWLWEREGGPPIDLIKIERIGKRMMVYADLQPNIPERYLTAPVLAELAIRSVPLAGDKNGIRYLADNISNGIKTPLSAEYLRLVLSKTKAKDLAEAEHKLRSISLWEVLKCEQEFISAQRTGEVVPVDFEYVQKQDLFVEARTKLASLRQEDPAKPQAKAELKRCESELASHVVAQLHSTQLVALCCSGGGIRSATFCLGLIEALAQTDTNVPPIGRKSLLSRFDYLSTVSGGGYIGAWLSSWIKRTTVDQVISDLRVGAGTKLNPEAATVNFLRNYTNYLNPKLGATSADTWALVATVIRNILLNWLVLLPLIMSALALSQVMFSGVNRLATSKAAAWPYALIADMSGTLAFIFLAVSLPVSEIDNPRPKGFMWFFLLPTGVAAASFSLFARLQANPIGKLWEDREVVAIGFALSFVFAFAVILLRARYRRGKIDVPWTAEALGVVLLSFILGSGVILAGLKFAPEIWSQTASLLFIVFSVPAALLTGFCVMAILVGASSRIVEEEDREWLARAGGWFLVLMCGWILLAGIGLFGWDISLWIASVVGSLISGTALSILGKSSKTASAQKSGLSLSSLPAVTKNRELAIRILLPIFVGLLLIAMSGLNQAILNRFCHTRIPPVLAPVVLLLGELALCAVASRWVNVNKFSLHDMYKLRLIRAYLGASRPEDSKTRNLFTGFDPEDNMNLKDLRQRPLHVVNMALNLVAGKRLAWQQRKAASFSASPFFAGSLWWGYRPVDRYSDEATGLTLGSATTISGAAASPNMGYHSSPLLTIIMTLFNARLGAWLGNPGKGGHGTWYKNGPTFGLRCYIDELFGLTDESNKWVYLSDGGHFENLGIYEMVLRRCRTILAIDASCDKDFVFQDLANAVRKIRIDLGVPIEFSKGVKIGKNHNPSYHWAVATIRYSEIDDTSSAEDGQLLYIKPSLTGNEPIDVLQYSKSHSEFPHESTADQWFTESQFESYRALGRHIGAELTKDADLATLDDLVKRAEKRADRGQLGSIFRQLFE